MNDRTPPKKDALADKIVDLMFLKHAFEDSPLTERYLSEQFNTSRTPVRDALKTLENDDLIERRKKKGVFLKKPTPKMISDLYDLRSVLEGFSIRQATESWSDDDLLSLEKSTSDFNTGQESGDYVLAEKANVAFHTKVIELSGNEMLIGMMRNINIIRKAFQYSYSLRPERQSIPSPCSHEDIIEHLRSRDADQCESIIKRHVQIGKQRMLEQALGFKIGR
jgi:DNA-binding GntR family transcriptional regulator